MLKRLLPLLAIVGLILTQLSACGSTQQGSSNSDVTLTYMTFSATPDHLKDLDTIRKSFESANPGIHVKVVPVAYDQYFTKLQVAIAGSSAPDSFELDYQDFLAYASKGSLLDLSKIAAKDSYAKTYNARALEAFSVNGTQYALPESFSDVLFFYNKDLFDKAHLPYPTDQWTWADELTAAQKLTGNGIWGDYEPVQFFEFYKALAQAGGQFFNADQTATAFNSPAGLAAVNWLVDKTNRYHVMPTQAQMGGLSDGDLFKSGKLAMYRTGIWMFSDFAKTSFKWDVVLEPGDQQKAHQYFANAVAISAKSSHSAQAYKWLSYLTSSSVAASTRIAASWELPAVSDTSLVDQYLKQTPPANRQAVFDAQNTLVMPPTIEKETQMQDIITKDLEKVQLGQLSTQAALSDMETRVNALLK